MNRTWLLIGVAFILMVLLATGVQRHHGPETVPAVADASPESAAPLPNLQQPDEQLTLPTLPGEEPGADSIVDGQLPEVITDEQLAEIWSDPGFIFATNSWARARGYPLGDDADYLDQPYQQYDNLTLQGLADNGDMWAAQILAERIATENPAEALELLRAAAALGSKYAMQESARLYERISSKRRELEFAAHGLAQEQVYAMRDAPVSPEIASHAWNLVSKMAGALPGMPGSASGELKPFPPGEMHEVCELARGIYDDLQAQRSALGLGDFDRSPPPFLWIPKGPQACDIDPMQAVDVDGCRNIAIDPEASSSDMWLCSDGQW